MCTDLRLNLLHYTAIVHVLSLLELKALHCHFKMEYSRPLLLQTCQATTRPFITGCQPCVPLSKLHGIQYLQESYKPRIMYPYGKWRKDEGSMRRTEYPVTEIPVMIYLSSAACQMQWSISQQVNSIDLQFRQRARMQTCVQ